MQKGFTLAEVLITLGIIGVVASLTLPLLIQNHQKRSLEVATQKFYSMMSQAVRQYMADEGVDDLRNTSLSINSEEDLDKSDAETSMTNFVNKYLKIVKECELNTCFASKYVSLNGDAGYVYSGGYYNKEYVLGDGMVMRIGYHNYDSPINIIVDVNGKKAPNKIGYDLWTMSLYYDGTIDESNQEPECKSRNCGVSLKEQRDNRFEYCLEGSYGGCFGHFLENNFKFDY